MNSESHIACLYPNHKARLTTEIWRRPGREFVCNGVTEVSLVGYDEFEVIRELGRGSFGTVFLARVVDIHSPTFQMTGRSVALKVFDKARLRKSLKSLTSSNNGLALAYSEIEATWALFIRHAPIVYHVLDTLSEEVNAADYMVGARTQPPFQGPAGVKQGDELILVAQEFMSGGPLMVPLVLSPEDVEGAIESRTIPLAMDPSATHESDADTARQISNTKMHSMVKLASNATKQYGAATEQATGHSGKLDALPRLVAKRPPRTRKLYACTQLHAADSAVQAPLVEAGAQKATVDLLMGLARLHMVGVAHNDIKPDNLLRNSRGLVCIGDFGLAKQLKVDAAEGMQAEVSLGGGRPGQRLHQDSLSSAASSSRATATATANANPDTGDSDGSNPLIEWYPDLRAHKIREQPPMGQGTALFWPPEQDKPRDLRAGDVWAAGITLHCMMTGDAPHRRLLPGYSWDEAQGLAKRWAVEVQALTETLSDGDGDGNEAFGAGGHRSASAMTGVVPSESRVSSEEGAATEAELTKAIAAWSALDEHRRPVLHPLCSPAPPGASWRSLYLWLTHPDQVQRPTALEALSHPWLSEAVAAYQVMDQDIRKRADAQVKARREAHAAAVAAAAAEKVAVAVAVAVETSGTS